MLKNSIWISSQENRQAKRHASILIAVENAKQAELAIEKRLCIAENWLIAEKCKENRSQIQCQNCQKFNHSTRNCFAQSVCQICAKQHKTSQHNCNIIMKIMKKSLYASLSMFISVRRFWDSIMTCKLKIWV